MALKDILLAQPFSANGVIEKGGLPATLVSLEKKHRHNRLKGYRGLPIQIIIFAYPNQ